MLCGSLDYAECECEVHRKRPYTRLTILILDCWQREYDERPYKHFKINRAFFEKRMRRSFNDSDWKVLIEFLGMRKMQSIKISYIPLPAFDDENLTKSLVKGMLNADTIRLKGVSLPVTFLQVFHKNITLSKVKRLELSENDLISDHLLLLRCILIESYTLLYFDIAGCFMNENTFPILADGIHKSKSIEGVDISRPCPMSPVSIFESLKFINTVAQLIWQNKLTELHLRQCNLNGHDMEPLSEYLASKDSKLLVLDLEANNIVSYGTEYLFSALAKSRTLKVLNLSANNLGSKGGVVIARYIAFTNIRSLDITHNNIGTEAIYELLSAIKKPCELKQLKLYGNSFNPKTAAVLKRLLRAKVLQLSDIDLTYTWDNSNDQLCVIPSFKSGRVHT